MIETPATSPPSFEYHKPFRGRLTWWLRCLGLVAFVLLLLNLPQAQENSVWRIEFRWLGACMALVGLQLLLEAFVWRWLLAAQRIAYPYRKAVVASLASEYLGLVTPGHVGELLAAGYISTDTGITFGYALSSVIMKKALNWVAIVGFGIWGLPLLSELSWLHGVGGVALGSLGALLLLSGGVAIWVVSLRRLTRRWEQRASGRVDLTEFWSGMRHLVSWKLLVPLAVTLLGFSLLFIQFDLVLRALGVTLPIGLLGQMIALSRFAARLIPMSVAGFGSKDVLLIMVLMRHGLVFSTAATSTLLFYLCSYLLTLLLSGLCWRIKPLTVRRAQRTSL